MDLGPVDRYIPSVGQDQASEQQTPLSNGEGSNPVELQSVLLTRLVSAIERDCVKPSEEDKPLYPKARPAQESLSVVLFVGN